MTHRFFQSWQQLLHLSIFLLCEIIAQAAKRHRLPVDKGSKIELLTVDWLVLDVEPLGTPADDRILSTILHIPERIFAASSCEAASANGVYWRTIASRIWAHLIHGFPKAKMGGDSQITLTESYEDGDMEYSVGGQLPDLHPINKQQPTKKLVGRKRETTEEEG